MEFKPFKYVIPAVALLFMLVWHFLAMLIDNEIILPLPYSVYKILTNPASDLISMGSLTGNIVVSLARVATGYFLAVALAVPLGIFMGFYGMVNKFFSTSLAFSDQFRPLPGCLWSLHGSGLQALPPSRELKEARDMSISTT